MLCHLRMAFFTTCTLIFILFASPGAIAYPSNEFIFDGYFSAELQRNASQKPFAFTCPVGSYLTMGERREREAHLTAAWKARLYERSKFGQKQPSYTSEPNELAASYEDALAFLAPSNRCSVRARRLSQPRQACGAWQAGAKKHSEFNCLTFLPNAARSEYFLVDALPLASTVSAAAAASATSAGAGAGATTAANSATVTGSSGTPASASSAANHATTMASANGEVGRVVVSRVWKTGTVALGNVFKCLLGKHCLHYSALEKPRGPYIEPAAPGDQRSSNYWGRKARHPKNRLTQEQSPPSTGASRQSLSSTSSSSLVGGQTRPSSGMRGVKRRSLQASTTSTEANADLQAQSSSSQAPRAPLPSPFVHAVMVREPMGRFISGYLEILARLTFGRPQADAIRAQEAARAARAEAKQASTEEAKVKAMAIIASALEDEAKKTSAAGLILMNGGGEFAWAVDFMRAKPGWPRMPPPPNLNARTAHAYEAARSGDLSHPPQQQQQDLRHLNDSAIGSTPTGGTTTTASGEGDVDSEAHAWLWAGAPSKEGKKEWDEAKRFEAFVNAVECGQPFLWWAHVASTGWFLNGPRHVLTRQEAKFAFAAGALSPADAAARSPPLPVNTVLRQETFAADLERLLFPNHSRSAASSGSSFSDRGDRSSSRRTSTSSSVRSSVGSSGYGEGGLGACRSVVSKRHNSGDEGVAARSHLPDAAFYRQYLAKNPPLLCRVVDLFLQDFLCFGYSIPAQCQSPILR